MSRPVRLLSCVLCILAVGACNTIPKETLDAYVASFDEARKAGEALTHDFAAARAELERREAASKPAAAPAPQPEIPLLYMPPTPQVGPISAAETRLLAWELVARYNTVLAALSAGESVETVKATTDRAIGVAVQLAGASVPGLGAITAAAKEIAGLLEQARLSAEFRKAVAGGVPKVRGILAILVADTSEHYRLRAALAEEDRVLLEDDRKVEKARLKAQIAALRQSLDRFVWLVRKCDESLAALQSAADKPVDLAGYSNELFALAQSLKGHWAAYQNARLEGAR